MTRTGRILAMDGSTATVRHTIVSCGTCSGDSCGVRTQDVRAALSNELDLDVGDWVEFSYPEGRAMFDALLVLGLPVGLFLVFYGVAPQMIQGIGEAARIAVGAFGFALGAAVPFLRNIFAPASVLPAVTRVLGRESLTPADSGGDLGRLPKLSDVQLPARS